MRRIALQEHFVIDSPEHIERWLSTGSIVPKAFVNELRPVISDVGERRFKQIDKAR